MVFKENNIILKYFLFVACKLILQYFRADFGTLFSYVCVYINNVGFG